MSRHASDEQSNSQQSTGRHTGVKGAFEGYPMGQSRRVTPDNNHIEDRGDNDRYLNGRQKEWEKAA